MSETSYSLRPVGWVESPLTDRDLAPCQGDEGAPEAWLALDPGMAAAMHGLEEGSEVIVLTWLDRADRDVYQVHPRGDVSRRARRVQYPVARQAESDRTAHCGDHAHPGNQDRGQEPRGT